MRSRSCRRTSTIDVTSISLVAGPGEAPRLYRNLRDGSFADVASGVGIAGSGAFTGIAAADVNKDGYTDYFFASGSGAGAFAMSDGKVKFATKPGPPGTENASAAQFSTSTTTA